MESLRGSLLISSGGLYDPNFRHTVVLIGEHNAEGALGVVLNRALDVSVAEAVPVLERLVPDGDPLFQGGPVDPRSPVLLAELSHPEFADIPVFESIGFLIGSIEAEVEPDSWIIDPARVEDVFTDAPDTLWARVLRRKGPDFHQLSSMPYDPSMN